MKNKVLTTLIGIGILAIVLFFGSEKLQSFFGNSTKSHKGHDHSSHKGDHKGHDHSSHKGEHKDHDEDKSGKEHDDHEGHDDHEEKESLSLSETELKEFDIEIATAKSGSFRKELSLTGEVVVDPDRVAHIASRVPGIVKKVHKKQGDNVKKDQIIATLESPQLAQAKIEYLSLKQQMELAEFDLKRAQIVHDNTIYLLSLLKESMSLEEIQEKTNDLDIGNSRNSLMSSYIQTIFSEETYKREKELHEQKISSRGDFLEAESEYKKAQANYIAILSNVSFQIKREFLNKQRTFSVSQSALNTAERRLHIFGLPEKDLEKLETQKESHLKESELGTVHLKSPLSGIIIKKHITLGEFLKEEEIPFVIANLSSVWGELSVYQRDLPFMRVGLDVEIESRDGQYESKGKIVYLSPVISEKTRTATARIIIENKKGNWRPGLFIKVKVTTAQDDAAVLIPKTAIQMIENQPHIFVKVKEGFESKAVKFGRSNETHVEIISGLELGEKYVSQGGFVLKAEMQKGGFDHGHSH